MNLPLEQEVYPEGALLEALGLQKEVLDQLRRDKGFPFVRINMRKRLYLASEVLNWLQENQMTLNGSGQFKYIS